MNLKLLCIICFGGVQINSLWEGCYLDSLPNNSIPNGVYLLHFFLGFNPSMCTSLPIILPSLPPPPDGVEKNAYD